MTMWQIRMTIWHMTEWQMYYIDMKYFAILTGG